MNAVECVELTRSLVDIDSTTGREGEAGRWLADYLRGLGYDVSEQRVDGTRFNVLATVAPDWFLEHTKPEWIERYGKPFEVEHTISESKKAERAALERAVAADGLFLLEAVFVTPCLGLKTCLLFMCCGVFGFRIILGRTTQLYAFATMKKSLQHVVSSTHHLILMRD